MGLLVDRPVLIPAGAAMLEGFRAWATSDQFPERGRIDFLDGVIVVDPHPEELESHNKVRAAIGFALWGLNKGADLGEFIARGIRLSNVTAGLSTVPDAFFMTWASYEAGRVRLTPRKGRAGQYVEVVGAPDWVLEVVSESSVTKDTRELRELYHRAGIPEFWLVDARGEELDFKILKWRRDRYVVARPRDGWHRLPTFGRRFRLERRRNRMGRWSYSLRVSA